MTATPDQPSTLDVDDVRELLKEYNAALRRRDGAGAKYRGTGLEAAMVVLCGQTCIAQIPALLDEVERLRAGMDGGGTACGPVITYLLWANDRSAWWRPGAHGYAEDINEAGRFTETDAVRYAVRSASAGRLDEATVMVAAPDNWEPPVAGGDPGAGLARRPRVWRACDPEPGDRPRVIDVDGDHWAWGPGGLRCGNGRPIPWGTVAGEHGPLVEALP